MRFVVALVAVLGLAGWAVARRLPEGAAEANGQSAPAKAPQIASIAVEVTGLSPAELRPVLQSRVGDVFDRAALERDRAALEAALVARGYRGAKVAAPQTSFDGAGSAFVTFAVDQGRLFHVRGVRVVGATDKEAGTVTLASGDVAAADRIANARSALAERLAARGKQRTVEVAVADDVAAAAIDVELRAK